MAKWLRQLGRVAGVAIVVLLFSVPVGHVKAAIVWQPTTIDSVGDVGEHTSLALDSEGHPHISYYDATNGDLKYAAFDGTRWQIQTVDAGGSVGQYSSLAVDSSGHPHISYFDADSLALKYATFDGATWNIVTVDSEETLSGQDSSLVLDSNDLPRIGYLATGPRFIAKLKYAAFDGTSWRTETVPNIYPGSSVSLALTSLGLPVICYSEQDDFFLECALVVPLTGWQKVTVDTGGSRVVNPSLALDSSDRPHFSYFDTATHSLKHTSLDGTIWQTETVDTVKSFGYGSSLELDGSGHPHISYFDTANAVLSYAAFDGTNWQIQTVDASGLVGAFNSLALDGSGQPYISYYDLTNGDLKYARLVLNEPPVADAGGPYSGTEDSPASLDGSVSDPDNDELTSNWSYAIDSADAGTTCTFGDAALVDTTFSCTDNGTFTVTLTTHDRLTSPVTDTATVTISNVAPTVTIDSVAEITNGETFTGTGSFSDPGANDTHTATVNYGDGSGEQELALEADGTFDLNHTYQSAGSYLLSVCGADDDDLAGGCDTITVSIVTAAPTVDLGGPYAGAEGSPVALNASITDAQDSRSTIWSYVIDSADPGTTCTITNPFQVGNNSFACTDDGTFTIGFAYMDAINPHISKTVGVTISNESPGVDLGDDVEITLGDTFSGGGSFSDLGVNDTHTAIVDYGDGSAAQPLTLRANGTFDLSYDYLDSGEYTVEVCVTDDDSGTGCDELVVTVINQAPTVAAGGSYSGDEGSPINLDGTVTDPENDSLTTTWSYAATSADDGTTCEFSDASQVDTTFTCTDDGSFTITLTADDGINTVVTDSATVTITNVAPTVTLGGDIELNEGGTATTIGSFTDPNPNDTHTATVDYGNGAGEQPVTLNADGSFSLSHTFPVQGEYQVRVCVTDDDQGSGCDALEVRVHNVAPTVTLGEDVAINQGDTYADTGSFSDPGGPPSGTDTYSATVDYGEGAGQQPLALNVDGSFSLNHTYLAHGQYTVEVCITDNDWGHGCDDLQVTVINQPPAVEAGDPYSGAEANPITLAGSVSDAENDSLTTNWSYQIDSADDGITCAFADTSAVDTTFTCTDDGTVTLTVEASDGINPAVSASTTVTIRNLAPTITEAVASLERDQVTITVEAADPSPNDTLNYAFDCDGDETYELESGVEPSASCPFNSQLEGVFSFGIQVSDDDGGIATDTVTVTIATNLCANDHTGVLRYSTTCQHHETTVSIPDPDGPVTVCASDHNGLLRVPLNGACADHETTYLLPEDGPLSVCVNTVTLTMRVVDDLGRCSSNDFGRVIAATEVGDLPPARNRWS